MQKVRELEDFFFSPKESCYLLQENIMRIRVFFWKRGAESKSKGRVFFFWGGVNTFVGIAPNEKLGGGIKMSNPFSDKDF